MLGDLLPEFTGPVGVTPLAPLPSCCFCLLAVLHRWRVICRPGARFEKRVQRHTPSVIFSLFSTISSDAPRSGKKSTPLHR